MEPLGPQRLHPFSQEGLKAQVIRGEETGCHTIRPPPVASPVGLHLLICQTATAMRVWALLSLTLRLIWEDHMLNLRKGAAVQDARSHDDTSRKYIGCS